MYYTSAIKLLHNAKFECFLQYNRDIFPLSFFVYAYKARETVHDLWNYSKITLCVMEALITTRIKNLRVK